MKNLYLISAIFCLGLCSAVAMADPGGNGKGKGHKGGGNGGGDNGGLTVQLPPEKVNINVALGNPTTVDAAVDGSVKTNVHLQGTAGQCLLAVYELAPGVCVPVGPGVPVSPN